MKTVDAFNPILKGVSRSFYLTIRILPVQVRPPIALAYLLARAADTLADTPVLPAGQRLQALQQFQQLLTLGQEEPRQQIIHSIQNKLQHKLEHVQEQQLLQLLPQLFVLLQQLNDADKQSVCEVVTTLTNGMIYDLQTFPDSGDQIQALQTVDALNHYTYLVAGCVGEFWTEICVRHLPALAGWSLSDYAEKGIKFGQGLQLVNITRDVCSDLNIGRCYVPAEWLQQCELTLAELAAGQEDARTRALRLLLVQRARHYFDSAQRYLLAIPRRCWRLRLACLWPLIIGLKTLYLLLQDNGWLQSGHTVKVTRGWVYQQLLFSMVIIYSNTLTRRYLGYYQQQLDRLIIQ